MLLSNLDLRSPSWTRGVKDTQGHQQGLEALPLPPLPLLLEGVWLGIWSECTRLLCYGKHTTSENLIHRCPNTCTDWMWQTLQHQHFQLTQHKCPLSVGHPQPPAEQWMSNFFYWHNPCNHRFGHGWGYVSHQLNHRLKIFHVVHNCVEQFAVPSAFWAKPYLEYRPGYWQTISNMLGCVVF